MVERLREALAIHFEVDPKQIALGASATACFQAVLDQLRMMWGPAATPLDVRFSGTPWPLFPSLARRVCFGRRLYVETAIGGATLPQPPEDISEEWLRDECHSWTLLKRPVERRRDSRWAMPDYSLFSFYPTKLCGAAEGGAVVCLDECDAENVQLLLNCGLRGMGESPTFSTRLEFGRKGNMTDVQAAFAFEALENLPQRMAETRRVWHMLFEKCHNLCDGVLWVLPQPVQPYLFQVLCRDAEAAKKLAQERGIGAQLNFPPTQYLTLPCWPGMSPEEIRRVAEVAVEVAGT